MAQPEKKKAVGKAAYIEKRRMRSFQTFRDLFSGVVAATAAFSVLADITYQPAFDHVEMQASLCSGAPEQRVVEQPASR